MREMKNRTISMAILAAVAACVSFSVAAGNMIENGDFETGKVAGWVNWMPGGKARIDDTLPHSGKWCLRIRCYKCHGKKPTNAMAKSLQMPW